MSEQESERVMTVPGPARPLTGALLGIVLGLCIAVVIQQQGIWPLDRLTVFLLPAVIGLFGLLLTSVGRASAMTTMVVSLVILLGLGVWGGLALGTTGEMGQLNGGCSVNSTSSLDSTVVTDTSRSDPFEIDPEGSLTWMASSPTVFRDYEWEIWVDIGGFPFIIDEDFEDNEGGTQSNSGSFANVSDQADVWGIPMDQLRGVFKVGGFAATCDGFAFVKLVSKGFLETLVAKIAAVVGVIALTLLLVTAFSGRKRLVEGPATTATTASTRTETATTMGDTVEPGDGDAM